MEQEPKNKDTRRFNLDGSLREGVEVGADPQDNEAEKSFQRQAEILKLHHEIGEIREIADDIEARLRRLEINLGELYRALPKNDQESITSRLGDDIITHRKPIGYMSAKNSSEDHHKKLPGIGFRPATKKEENS